QSGNKTALHSRRGKFENGVRAGVCFKAVSRTIDGQSRGEAQTGCKSALCSSGCELEDRAITEIRRIKISTSVKGQSGDRACPARKGGLSPVCCREFQNVAAAGIRFKQIPRTVQGQADRRAQSRSEGAHAGVDCIIKQD